MPITVSNRNDIVSPDGNSLAVFKDSITGNIFVKDINGNVQNVDFTSTVSTLQQVLDAGNTATQNMSVDGTVDFGSSNSTAFAPSFQKFVAGESNTLQTNAFVIGNNNFADGNTPQGGYIIGSQNNLGNLGTPTNSIIIGRNSVINGQDNYSLGFSNSIDGTTSVAIGNNLSISNSLGNNIVIGTNSTVPLNAGARNFGLGYDLTFSNKTGTSTGELVMGLFNINTYKRNGYIPKVAIGVGADANNRENAISIQKLVASPNTNLIQLNGRVEVSTGMVISPNPQNIQVDDSSLVIGAGNNDIVDGSDHCLAVGNGIQILDGSDQSLGVGSGSSIIASNNSMILGRAGTIRNSVNSAIVGENNRIGGTQASDVAMSRSMAIGSSHIIEGLAGGGRSLGFAFGFNHTLQGVVNNSMALGFGNSITTQHRNSIMVGGSLNGQTETMTMGFRNNINDYPASDTAQGLGLVKYVIAVGSTNTTNANAILITEGGQGSLIPRIIMPTLLTFDFTSDTDAGNNGIPVGGLYHNSGQLFIRRT